MAEKHQIIDGLELRYKGLFDLNELLKAFDKYSTDRGYSKAEKRRQELISRHGKEFSIELRPTKIKTEYYYLMIKARIHISGLKEVEVIKDKKKKQKLNEGEISIVFDAFVATDYKFRWEQKPGFYFLRLMADKFIKRTHIDKYVGELVSDTHYVYDNIKAHLNLYKF